MTALNEMQLAISTLEAERAAAGPAPWTAWRGPHRNYVWTFGLESAHGDIIAAGMSAPDAVLAERLHRTVDAQLAILADGVANYWEPGDAPDRWESFASNVAILRLARAINGTG